MTHEKNSLFEDSRHSYCNGGHPILAVVRCPRISACPKETGVLPEQLAIAHPEIWESPANPLMAREVT